LLEAGAAAVKVVDCAVGFVGLILPGSGCSSLTLCISQWCAVAAAACSSIERRQYAQGWEALREIRGPFYAETYAEFMSIVRAAATAPKVGWVWCVCAGISSFGMVKCGNHVSGLTLVVSQRKTLHGVAVDLLL
jgi:hypothetical protein